MTLIISYVQKEGIVLATDGRTSSIDTYKENKSNYKKYHYFNKKNKSISIWGLTNPFKKKEWDFKQKLIELINSYPDKKDLKEIADEIAIFLNNNFNHEKYSDKKIGIHLCGYREYEGKLTPCLYHICAHDLTEKEKKSGKFKRRQKIKFVAQNDIDVGAKLPDGRFNGIPEIFAISYPSFRQLEKRNMALFKFLKKPTNKENIPSIKDNLKIKALELMGEILLLGSYCDKMGYEVIGGNLYYCTFNEKGLIKEGSYLKSSNEINE